MIVDISKLQLVVYAAYDGYTLKVPIVNVFSNCEAGTDNTENATTKDFSYAEYTRTQDYAFNEKMSPIFQFKLKVIYCPDVDLQLDIPGHLKKYLRGKLNG